MMDKLTFIPEGEETPVDFYVLEQTRIAGTDYILVADSEEDDGECLILKDLSKDTDAEAVYEIVEDDNELDSVMQIFLSLLDEDVEIVR